MNTDSILVLAAELPAEYVERVETACSEAPFDLQVADDLSSGLAQFDAAGPDVVLLGLPSGDSAVTRLEEALAAAGRTPVIAVGGVADERAARAVRRGCADFLEMDAATVTGVRRAVEHTVGVARLERERERLEEFLERNDSEAFVDPGTGVPSRALFMDRLERAVARRRRSETRDLAVLYVDVDRFETVNEGLGHRVGDELLRALAQRLEEELRQEDTIARMGGDEFAIMLDGIEDPAAPTHVVERIMTSLEEPFELAGREVFVSVSIGIAIADTARDPKRLLRDADTAMHKAKERGLGSYRIFDPVMHDSAVALFELETDLRRALERDEFVIHYQPVLDLVENRLAGFEALVRWQHPERGMVQPDNFLRAAEDTGLILGIGAHVLRSSLEQLREWRELGAEHEDVFMSVNLSPRQFSDPGLVETIRSALDDAGVPANLLRLELTENVVINDPEAVATTLGEIQAMGVTLCIDDFGTGYSALNYLHSFPIDVIKIDRSFISRIQEDMEGDLVEVILALARTFGISAVAEGVETEMQLAHLRKLGSMAVQGFLFSTPLDAEAATRYLLDTDE